MTLTLIEGQMNNGKTLVLTFHALKDYLEGRKIITNYNINIPHYEINKDYLTYLAVKQPDTTGLSFFLDELWLWLDSRNAMSNKILSYFFLQSSKNDTRVYLSVQRDNQLDIRVRENAHVILKCERRLLIKNKMRRINNRIRDLGKQYYPIIYIKVKDYDNNFSNMTRYLEAKSIYYLKACWLFNFYNTHQKIKHQANKNLLKNMIVNA